VQQIALIVIGSEVGVAAYVVEIDIELLQTTGQLVKRYAAVVTVELREEVLNRVGLDGHGKLRSDRVSSCENAACRGTGVVAVRAIRTALRASAYDEQPSREIEVDE
jgi:hypothetical protein